ncbi:acyl-CoA N-acyltransferase [Aspergillus varians]
MPLQLRLAVETDIDQLTDAFFSGFRKDAVVARSFPEKPSVREFWNAGLQRDLQNPDSHVVAIIDTDLPGSPVIAYASWFAPSSQPPPDQPQPTPAMYPEEAEDHALAELFFNHLKERREVHMAGRKCWYLALLVCHEDHQRRGAGAMLMQYGSDLANKMQADMYVEASPPGVPVYTRFGFKEVERLVVLDGTWTELMMLKEYQGV